MPYLENIPSSSIEYGVNKLLVVRTLSIDWKHRDTEINLRDSKILDNLLYEGYSLRDIYKTRSNQLRYIYHLPRSVLKYKSLDIISNFFDLLNKEGFHTFPGNIFLDFETIKAYPKLNKSLLNYVNIFSFKVKQKDMIQYFISNNISIPKNILMVKNVNELKTYLDNNISLLLYSKNTFNPIELSYLWVCNYHLYEHIDNEFFSRVSLKTDSKLPLPFML